LIVALRERSKILRDDSIALAEALAQVCEHLPKAEAAGHAARAIDVLVARLGEPVGVSLYATNLAPAIETLAPHLDAAAAQSTADALEGLIRQAEVSVQMRDYLAKALLAVCRRLPPSDAAAPVNRMADFIVHKLGNTKEENKWYHHPPHTKTLATLSEQLDPAAAARVAGEIVAVLGSSSASFGSKRDEFVNHFSIPKDLAIVAERLDALGSLRTAEALIVVLKKAEKTNLNMEELRTALFSVCRRLDAAGSARVADAIAVAVQDPKTPMLARSLLASAFAVVGDRLDPEKAAALASAMMDPLITDLADAKSRNFRGHMVMAFESVGGRPGAKSAARTAKALTVAICDQQTPIAALKSLAAALDSLCDRLGPVEAYSHASESVDALDSLWIARTRMFDRATLAEAMATLWKRLSPHVTTGRVRRVAASLKDALGDAKLDSSELLRAAEALTAVCGHLEPAERVGHVNSAVDILVARFQPRPDVPIDGPLWKGLATLSAHLDRQRVAHLADALFTALCDSEAELPRTEFNVGVFKRFAAQMDERDIERFLEHPLAVSFVQRNLLDILGASRGRHFRNTWDYLDWVQSNGNGADVLKR
jgi:hypothetical protein